MLGLIECGRRSPVLLRPVRHAWSVCLCACQRPDGSEKPAFTMAYAAGLADGVGFEPTNPCGLAVFKTAALSHSATHPSYDRFKGFITTAGEHEGRILQPTGRATAGGSQRAKTPARVAARAGDHVAGGPGFEPRLPGPEPGVLPLNYPPSHSGERGITTPRAAPATWSTLAI